MCVCVSGGGGGGGEGGRGNSGGPDIFEQHRPTPIFHYFKTSNFNIFWGFRKMAIFGVWKFL